jgi:GGDEF domain-containing protein
MESARDRAEEWRQAVQNLFFSAQPIFVEQGQGENLPKAACQIRVTVSIGIACFSPNRIKKEQVIAYADRALYRAKNDGRNRVEVYDKEA